MSPLPPSENGKLAEPPKSWKKINEERKALKRKRKQDKLLKDHVKAEKLNELAKSNAAATIEANKPNPSTVSIAVPGSILENAQSVQLRTYVAGQIARAACIFRVNEVIVYDDVGLATGKEMKRNYAADEDASEEKTVRGSSLQLARILQYLECPQYLRKFFFPLHKDLQFSGLLNPLDAPHHLRQQNVFPYREGIVAEKRAKAGHCFVNVGLLNDVLVSKELEAGVRVTVKLDNLNEQHRKLRGTLVSPDEPRRETGAYWGYTVRIAHSISDVFTKSPYESGYDLSVGTSDRGANIHEVPSKSFDFNHLLIVFGGLKGLETALQNDDKLNVDDPELLFDHYVNVLPTQGSRTIRTEEAILITMSALQEKLQPQVADIEETFKEFLPQSEDTGMKGTQVNVEAAPFVKHQKLSKPEQADENFKVTTPELTTQQVHPNKRSEPKQSNKKTPKIASPKKAPIEKEKHTASIDDIDAMDFEVVPTDVVLSARTVDDDDLSRFD